MIEYKDMANPSPYWTSFGYEPFNTGRDYQMFANLAGVRGEPKNGKALATGFGLPENVCFATKAATCVRVTEGNKAAVEGWVQRGLSKWVDFARDMNDKPMYVTHPDLHSHGWCDVKDWKKATRGRRHLTMKCFNAVIDTLTRNECDVRVVFWFDN